MTLEIRCEYPWRGALSEAQGRGMRKTGRPGGLWSRGRGREKRCSNCHDAAWTGRRRKRCRCQHQRKERQGK